MAPSKESKTTSTMPLPANLYASLEGIDGNPRTPAEFDMSPHEEGEFFFRADDDATEAERKKIIILNYIHQELHQATERKVPALSDSEQEHTLEIYHRATFQGQELEVGVYFRGRDGKDDKECVALVKFVHDDLPEEDNHAGSLVFADAACNADAQADPFTKKKKKNNNNNTLTNHYYWAPRWKYVVKTLRDEMAQHYQRNGACTARAKPARASDAPQILKEEFMVFSGSTGKIFGPRGAQIAAIRNASRCKDIQLPPPRTTDQPRRPNPRAEVALVLVGTARQISKAKILIQQVVDEWANAPRPSRHRRGPSGSGSGHGQRVGAATYRQAGDGGDGRNNMANSGGNSTRHKASGDDGVSGARSAAGTENASSK